MPQTAMAKTTAQVSSSPAPVMPAASGTLIAMNPHATGARGRVGVTWSTAAEQRDAASVVTALNPAGGGAEVSGNFALLAGMIALLTDCSAPSH